MINWCREIKNHSYLEPICIYGSTLRESYLQWQDGKGIGVTTYETVNKFDFQSINNIDMLVVDEAHYIKNPNAQRTKNLLKIAAKAEKKLFMTGTPLENKIDEMCFLINCLQPKIAKQIAQNKELIGADQFKEKVAPVYLRRIRKDVLGELPNLIESKEWGIMNAEEENAYRNSVINESFMGMRRVSWNVDNIHNSTKNNRLIEICEDAKNEGRKIVVFSYFRDVLEKIKECLKDDALEIINGSIPVQKRQEILDDFNESKPGTILISQIQAGGTGLNMQCASVVILCEPQFKPSIENQAISRVYRMGQARNVEVHRLLMENCIDERLMDIINSKQRIFDSYADESVVAKTDEEYNKAVTNIIAEEKARLEITA